MSKHTENIHKLVFALKMQDIPLDNAAYKITIEEGNELAKELHSISDFLLTTVSRSNSAFDVHGGIDWRAVHGGMYAGIRILVYPHN